MKMNNICPVCNKPGLPDYRIQETVCPQCNSNLKSYVLLNSIKRRSRRFVGGILAIAVLLSVLAVILHFTSANKSAKIIDDKITKLEIANDSIDFLIRRINQFEVNENANSSPEKPVTFIYKVRDGDNLGKIAELFFDDYRKFEKIAEDNNLTQPYLLLIGQPLTIKITQ